MRRRGVLTLPFLLGAAIALGEAPRAPRAPAIPAIRIEAEAASRVDAATLEAVPEARLEELAGFVGLGEPGRAITVVLLREEHEVARATPREIGGYAVPARDLAVVFPARASSYPYRGSLSVVYLHELSHLFLTRAAGSPLPRWFDEGVALVASRDWSLADRGRVLAAGLGALPASTRELDDRFTASTAAAERAYALAGELVRRLLEEHGDGVVAEIAAGMAAGVPFADAFAASTGEPLAAFEARFWRHQRLWTRWIPFATSGTALWLAITALALAAGVRRRRRDLEQRQLWEAEERDASLAR